MIAYVLTFGLSGVIGLLASRAEDDRYKTCLSILAAIPLCLLASLRGLNIGTDTDGYPLDYFTVSQNEDLISIFEGFGGTISSVEPLFVMLTWIITRLTGSFQVLLFVIQLLTVIPIILTVRAVSPRHIGFGVVMYSLLFFAYSLNAMRQSIATAMLLPVFYFTASRQVGKAIAFSVAGCGFHLTGGFGFLVILYIWLLSHVEKNRTRYFISGCVLAAPILSICLLALAGLPILTLLATIKPSYSFFIDTFGDGGWSISALLLSLVAVICTIALVYDQRKRHYETRHAKPEEKQDGLLGLTTLSCASGICSQFSLFSDQLARLGTAFLPFYIIQAAYLASLAEPKMTRVLKAVFVLTSAAYAIYLFVICGNCEVFPYFFFWEG